MNMIYNLKNRRGFTLIELLVVISIIVILVGLLMPGLESARMAGRQTQCGTHLHHLYNAYFTHISEVDRKMSVLNAPGWPAHLTRYTKQAELLFCPEELRSQEDKKGVNVNDLYLKVLKGGTYAYDMPLAPEQWTIMVNNTTPENLWQLPKNPSLTAAEVAAIPDGTYFFYFEDIRPDGGDKDYNDVILKITEMPGGLVEMEYIQDSAGYTFDLVNKDGTEIWTDMNNGGGTTVGSTTQMQALQLADYGMNSMVKFFNKGGKEDTVLLIDYMQSVATIVIDPKYPATSPVDDWSQWVGPSNIPIFARHPGYTINVAYKGGHVFNQPVGQVDPAVPGNLAKWHPYK
jgi:prepilin-type N-terminal cleavage/methylation domain-containing protein